MQNDLLNVKHKLINTALFYAMFLAYPVVASSIWRMTDIGWQNIFYYHIGVALSLTIIYTIRNTLSLQLKAHLYAIIFGSINLVGMLTFGIVSGISYYVCTVIVVTIVLDKKAGLFYTISFIVAFCLIMLIYTNHISQVKIDLSVYNTLHSAWIMTLLGFVYVLLITNNTLGVFNQFFFKNIEQLNHNISQLKITQKELEIAKNSAEEPERQLRQISDNFENGMIYQVIATDETSRKFTYLSESATKFYGCTVEEAKNDASLIYGKTHPDDKQTLIELEKESLKNMTVFRATVRTYKPDGTMRWVYLVSKPRRANGYVMWDGLEFDISDIKQSQSELEMFKKFIDFAPVGAYWFSGEGKIEYVNNTGSSMLGYSKDELITKNISDINNVVKQNPSRWKEEWEIMQNGETFKTETIHMRKDGSIFPVEVISSYFEGNNKAYHIGFAIDITERKKAEEALQNSEKMYRSLFDNMTSGLILFETINDNNGEPYDFKLLQVNAETEKISGLNRETEQGKTSGQMYIQIPDEYKHKYFNIALTGGTFQYERYIPEIDKLLEVHVFSPNHGLFALLINDITERKNQEKKIQEMIVELEDNNLKLKESEEKFRVTFENAGIGIAIVDNSGKPVLSNKALQTMLGYTHEELATMAFSQFTHPDDISIDWNLYAELIEGKRNQYHIDKRYIAKDGTIIWSKLTVTLLKKLGYALGMAENITERKQAEIALRENEEHLQYLLHSVTDYIYSSKLENNEVYETLYGEGCKTVTGYTINDFRNNKYLWIDIVLPVDRDIVLKQAENIIKKHIAEPVEHRIMHKNGEIIWVRNTPVLRLNAANEISGYDGLITNITERKKLEQQILASIIETEEKERMNFSQELHDGIGPLISAIKMYIQLLKLHDTKMKIEEVAEKAEELTDEASRSLREISFKLSPHILQNYGLIEALSAFIVKIRETKKIEINLYHKGIGRYTEITETIVYRVLCECINNTLKHAGAKEIRLSLLQDNDILEVDYSDNGKGFDLEKLLIEKKGIGLLNMQSRVKSIGGQMDMTSQIGSGMNVKIKITEKVTNSILHT